MQNDFEASHPGSVEILAVNEFGFESGLDEMSALGDLPLLQDIPDEDAWQRWAANWRDVYILDADNVCFAVYNVTQNKLGETKNYEELKGLFEAAINGEPSSRPCP